MSLNFHYINYRNLICFCNLLIYTVLLKASYSEKICDSLLLQQYDFLEEKIFDSPNDLVKSLYFGRLYLKKAKKEENINKITDGYYFLSLIAEDNDARKYLDSLSRFSIKHSLDKKLALAQQAIGKLLYEMGDIQGALDHYLMAIKVMDKSEQAVLYHILTHNIGLIRGLIGQNAEALQVYQEYLQHLQKDGINGNEINNYLVNLFSLSHSFTEIGLLDSATYYNKLGIAESKKYNRPRHYAKFVLGEGYNLFFKEDLVSSLDSLKKSVPLMLLHNDKMNAAIGFLYLGKIQLINSPYQPPSSLFKADSIIATESRYYPELVEIYELLNDYYKKIGDSELQLRYLEKLINYDENLQKKYTTLYKTITREYDQPRLLAEKELIINRLENKNANKIKGIITLLGAVLLLSSLAISYYRKRLTYKKRFEQLVRGGVSTKPINSKPKGISNIQKKVVSDILMKISSFEEKEQFLDSNLSLARMASKLETNSNYLSRIINHYKEKNFNNYINDLRIIYATEELKRNHILRKYTIKAIALEVGFKNAESFTNAFYKRVGIYPSYYIKELIKSYK